MDQTIRTSKLNDFKLLQKSKPKGSQSLTSRNVKNNYPAAQRTQQPTSLVQPGAAKHLRRHINSVNQHPIADAMNTGRSSKMHSTQAHGFSGDAKSTQLRSTTIQGSTIQQHLMQSIQGETVSNAFGSTDRFGFTTGIFKGQANDVIKMRDQADETNFTAGETVVLTSNSRQSPIAGHTTQNWHQNERISKGYQTSTDLFSNKRETNPISSAGRSVDQSFDGHRPSIMSDSINASKLMATRVPYRQGLGAHSFRMSAKEMTFENKNAPEKVQNFGVTHNAPMSPGARQRLTIDKIQHMTQRARGQLQPGQPTAKQYADQLREQRAMTCPQDFGDESPFVHNTTGKPITTYKYEKFKEMNRLKGIELDQKIIGQDLAQKFRKRRSLAKRDRSNFDRQNGIKNMINYKGSAVDLYSAEDKERMARGLKPEIKIKDQSQMSLEGTENQETTTSVEATTVDMEDTDIEEKTGMTKKATEQLLRQLKAHLDHDVVANVNLSNRRGKKYDLWGGKKTLDDFKSILNKQIKKQTPEVNIAEIAEQFFHREVKEGPAAHSNNIIFKKTLQQERVQYFDLNNQANKRHPHEKPLFHLTKDPIGDRSTSPMKAITEEKEREESPPHRFFTLHNYDLKQLQECYQAYYQVHKTIVYAAAESKRYKKLKDAEEIKILQSEVVKEIRQNPKMEHIAKIIEDPLTHALIRILITYEKYNYEPEEFGVGKAMNSSGADLFGNEEENMFSDARPFKEIELMKELVIEFGTAIDERIKDDDGQPEPSKESSPRKDLLPSQKSGEAETILQMDSLSGRKLRKQAKKNTYMTIDRYIADHPEFELIKEDAKNKLLDRIQKYKENSVAGEYSGNLNNGAMSPGMSDSEMYSPMFKKEPLHLGKEMGSPEQMIQVQEPRTPLGSKSQRGSTFEPRRRSVPKRSKLTLQQFVQSTHFQDAFTELIQTLDNHYKKRREQTKQAAQYINKHVFYQLAKDSITNNAADNPNIDYMNDCYDRNVMPFPIYSKISGNMLKLVGYYLNDGYCQAMEKYLRQQSTEEALIEKMVLHGNNCSDESFAAILMGSLSNSKLKHLHYSLNDLGHKSNEALKQLLQAKFPKQLESLILSNLKTTGKAVSLDKNLNAIEEGKQPETPLGVPESETGADKKINVVHQITINLLHTESLHKLVLQDLNLGESAQKNLVLFVQQNSKLENLQLINCKMMPEYLAQICKELETQQGLINLNFRKNVIRNREITTRIRDGPSEKIKTLPFFVTAMTELIKAAPALMHLDISGMFIGDEGIKSIIEGVAESKILAAIHFQDNKISHWTRLSIFTKLKRKTKSQNPSAMTGQHSVANPPDEPQVSSFLPDSKLSFDPHASFDLSDFEDDESSRQKALQSRMSNMSLNEQKGIHQLTNQVMKGKSLDQKLDKDEIDEDLLLRNISEMVKANMPIINFPESQLIIDNEILKEKKPDMQGVQMENIEGGIAQDLIGTLYSRVSKNPSLYQDKVERDKYFAQSKWLSVSYHTGCWICNSNKIIDRMHKKSQSNYISHYESKRKSVDCSEV